MKVNIKEYCADIWAEKDKELPWVGPMYDYDKINLLNSKRTECEKISGRVTCKLALEPRAEFNVDNPYYSRKYNELYMPNIQHFLNEEWYYSSFFHEITHATGPIFGREVGNWIFGIPDGTLCQEEITAEMAAYCLSRIFNFKTDTLKWSARYIQNYMEGLTFQIPEALYTKVTLRVEETVNYLVEKI